MSGWTMPERISEWFRQGAIDTQAILDSIVALDRPRIKLMNEACEYVLLLGYAPNDCLIEHQRMGGDGDFVERLKVNGETFIEITVERRTLPDYQFTVTTTPRYVTWPPFAPQVRASSDAGDP